MPHLERHVFICENQRDSSDPRGCCSAKNSLSIREEFKRLIAEAGLKGKVRANSAGCLDQCARGPSIVVYPEQVWYTVPTIEDAREIFREHIVGGRPVKRLQMPEP